MPTPAEPDRITLDIVEESLVVLRDRALYWARRRTLLIADLHLGKAASFRAAGVAVPEHSTHADLARLGALLSTTRAERLVVLGDLLHARAGRTSATIDAFTRWRTSFSGLTIELIRGNHDRHAGDPPESFGMTCESPPVDDEPFVFVHEPPEEDPRGYALCGHLHPAVRLHAPGRQSVRLPCVWFGRRAAVLPAFGSFTGTSIVRPRSGDRVIAITPEGLFDIPTTRRRPGGPRSASPAPDRAFDTRPRP